MAPRLEVALLTERRVYAAAMDSRHDSKAATCSREQAPSSLDMSALRSHVVERRGRLLH